MKTCGRCKTLKPMDAFRPSARSRVGGACRPCWASYMKEWRHRNPDKAKAIRIKQHARRKAIPHLWERHAEQTREQLRNLKARAYAALGDQCKCCGKPDRLFFGRHFLQIDHVNNDGGKDRRRRGSRIVNGREQPGASHYRLLAQIVKTGRPDLQLLCPDCNWMKDINRGICPHEEARVVAAVLSA